MSYYYNVCYNVCCDSDDNAMIRQTSVNCLIVQNLVVVHGILKIIVTVTVSVVSSVAG